VGGTSAASRGGDDTADAALCSAWSARGRRAPIRARRCGVVRGRSNTPGDDDLLLVRCPRPHIDTADWTAACGAPNTPEAALVAALPHPTARTVLCEISFPDGSTGHRRTWLSLHVFLRNTAYLRVGKPTRARVLTYNYISAVFWKLTCVLGPIAHQTGTGAELLGDGALTSQFVTLTRSTLSAILHCHVLLQHHHAKSPSP